MWITAHYQPVSFFSLRPANATTSGGKTLLVPTPFAIKMALLATAIQSRGIAEGERLFPFLKDLQLYLEPPQELIVIKSFSKIRREFQNKTGADKNKSSEEKAQANAEKINRIKEEKAYPFQPTIAYREHVNYHGMLSLACQLADESPLADTLATLLMQINYLGKRGGFLQIMEPPSRSPERPAGQYIELTAAELQAFPANGTLQMLDDCGPKLTFDKANIYNEARITLHSDRIMRYIVLPYRQLRSSRSYIWYQRFDLP